MSSRIELWMCRRFDKIAGEKIAAADPVVSLQHELIDANKEDK